MIIKTHVIIKTYYFIQLPVNKTVFEVIPGIYVIKDL